MYWQTNILKGFHRSWGMYLRTYSPYLDSLSLVIMNLRIQLELICWALYSTVWLYLSPLLSDLHTQPIAGSHRVYAQGSITCNHIVVNIKIMYYKILNNCILFVYVCIILRHIFIAWVIAPTAPAILFSLHHNLFTE